jgi:hypothetical protein
MGFYNTRLPGEVLYNLWTKFVAMFITEFCPKNKTQVARLNLEILKYFQGD